MGFVRVAIVGVSGCVLVASFTLATSCGFDGEGSDNVVPGGEGGTVPTPDGSGISIPFDPDAAASLGCNWPTLQADAPWPMLGGCVTHSGRSAFRGPRKQPHEVWVATVRNYRGLPSIAADGTIYVPADTDGLVAFSPDGGRRLIDVGGGDVTSPIAIGQNGTIYAGAGNYAVARTTDGGRTRFDLNENVDTSALIDANGNVYMGSYADKLVSLDPSGKLRWSFPTGGDVKSSAAIGPSGDIYVGTNNNNRLFAIRQDGTKRWEFDTGASVESSPVVADDGTIYVGTTGSKLHALSPDGQKKWTYDAPGSFGWQVLPALGRDGIIYAPAGSRLLALRTDGTLYWSFDAGSTLNTPPVVDADGIVYVGGDSSQLFAIKPDGDQLWKVNVGNDVRGFAIARDGTMYVVCESDKLHVLHE